MNLADWGPISTDSAEPGYTGPPTDTVIDQSDPTKFFSSAYYSDLILKFQSAMNSLDDTYNTFTQLLPTLDPTADADNITAIHQWLSDYQAKKTEIQAVAATINGIVGTVNAATGAGMPKAFPPQSLQQWQPIAVVGLAAAVAAALAVISWAAQQIVTAQNITAQIQSLPPDQRAAALANINAAATAASPLANVASIIQWVVIAALVWFGYKAFREYQGGRHALASAEGDE